jgi:hypothetical protein
MCGRMMGACCGRPNQHLLVLHPRRDAIPHHPAVRARYTMLATSRHP